MFRKGLRCYYGYRETDEGLLMFFCSHPDVSPVHEYTNNGSNIQNNNRTKIGI